jgi:hypothetical protein
LRRQRFVVRHDQRGLLRALNHLRDGVRLAGARGPQQRLVTLVVLQARHQLINRLRLIAHRLEIRDEFKSLRHAVVLLLRCRSRKRIRHQG